MWNAILVLALSGQQGTGPAFLDSFQTIHVPLDRPMSGEELSSVANVTIDGKKLAVKSVRPCGEPGKERRLPKTEGRVVLPGTIQSALGGKDWDPDGEVTQMTETSPGVYELVVELPAGSYEFKVARNGSWDENYGEGFVRGAGNIRLKVPRKEPVKFVVDFKAKTLLDSIDQPTKVHAPQKVSSSRSGSAKLKYPVAEVTLAVPLKDVAVDKDIEVELRGQKRKRVYARGVLSAPAFVYSGPLGAEWAPTKTTFRV
jgi:hypothetical protein